jgi:hypothetical protein
VEVIVNIYIITDVHVFVRSRPNAEASVARASSDDDAFCYGIFTAIKKNTNIHKHTGRIAHAAGTFCAAHDPIPATS